MGRIAFRNQLCMQTNRHIRIYCFRLSKHVRRAGVEEQCAHGDVMYVVIACDSIHGDQFVPFDQDPIGTVIVGIVDMWDCDA